MDNYKDWLYALLKTEPIPPEDIPDIGLYMDQVTTLMDTRLAGSKRYPDDKILTKTMINNYTKNHLLPPSDKKKYSRTCLSSHYDLLSKEHVINIRYPKPVRTSLREVFSKE